MATKPRGLQPHAWLITRLLRPVVRTPAKARVFNVTVRGKEHIPATGAAILAGNHQSFADPLVVWGSARRNVVAVAMKELWRTPLVFLMWLLGMIPIERGNTASGQKARQRMRRVVESGGLLLIFPEGKCSRDGSLLDFKPGAADIACETNTPIVPFGIAGANRLLPLGSKWPDRKQPVVICYGQPIDPLVFASAELVNAALHDAVEQLMAEADALRQTLSPA